MTVRDASTGGTAGPVEVTRDTLRDAAARLAGMMEGATAADVERELIGVLDDNSPRPIPLGDIWRTSPSPREPVIDGLLRRGQVGNLISTSKSYKTYLILGLAISFVMRRDWLDRFPCVGGRALVIDLELQRPDITKRTRDIGVAMHAPDALISTAIEMIPLRGHNGSIENIERILLPMSPRTYDLVIIDPLYKCYPDPFDENNNAQMTSLYRRFERLAEHIDGALMIVHHGTKGVQSDKRTVDIGAGASAQSRSADCHIALREHEQPDAVVLDARVRSFPPIDPLVLRWEYPQWQRDLALDPNELKTGRRGGRAAAQPVAKEKPEPWTPERFVTAFVTDEPKDKKLIVGRARFAGVPFNQIDTLLALAIDSGHVFPWSYAKDRTTYLANVEQTVSETCAKLRNSSHSHTHTPPRTPRVRQKSPRRGGTDVREGNAT